MDKIAALLEKLAGTVGVQVERLWPEVVRAYWWQQVTTAVIFPLALWLLYVIARRVARTMPQKRDSYDDSRVPYYLLIGALTVLGVVVLVSILAGFGTTLSAIINPEGTFVLDKLNDATGRR